MWITVKKLDGTRYNHATEDPLLRKANGTTPVVEREPGAFPTPTGQANMDEWIDYLYENHFEIITRDNLESTSPADWKFTWYDEYYFFGLHQNILAGLPYLAQTQGWPDLVGAMGTFDPLQ